VTLIEMMIALLITSVLITLAAPNFAGWIRNQRIRTASEGLLNGLQMARAEALKTNTVVSFQIGTDWTVTRPCTLEEVKGDASCATVEVQSGQWSRAEVAPNPPALTTFSFNGLGRLVSSAGALQVYGADDDEGSACAATGGDDRCLRIDVKAGGGIRLCDPALSLTNPNDPQACQ
jgi:type IV fimbrial biogenesis protein FimT